MSRFLSRRSLNFFVALALLFSSSGTSFAQQASQTTPPAQTSTAPKTLDEKLAAIEKLVDAKRKEFGIPGAALVIVKDDKVILLKTFGVKDFEKNLPVTPDTLFAIASSTKAFTALAAAMSADTGKLSLDDSPKKFLPYFKLRDPEADAGVTIRDLLSNRSGLNRADLLLAFHDKLTREETIRVMGHAKPSAKLREKWQYQNIMFAAAGETVAKAEGRTWENDIAERIFKPLGMKSSNATIPAMLAAPDFSYGYEYNVTTKETKRVPMLDLSNTAPDGAINSTARDMAQWLRFMLAGGVIDGKRLVSEKNFAELIKPHITIAQNYHYGLGWFIRDWRGRRIVEHGGNLPGFSAEVAMIPEEKLGLVLLTNVYASPLGEITKQSVWSQLSTPPQTTSAPAQASVAPVSQATPANAATATQDATREAGQYKFTEANSEVKVSFEGGKLLIHLPGSPPLALEQVSGRRYKFAAPAPAGLFATFQPSASNPADEELVLEVPQGTFTLPKIKLAATSMTADELMSKVIAAQGGEAALRSHKSMRTVFTQEFENQGITAEGTTHAKAPNLSSTSTTMTALNKTLGTTFSYFDGTTGASTSSFRPPQTLTGRSLEDARINSDFYATLNWKTNFKSVTVKGLAKVGDEDAYVVEKVPEKGNRVVDYYSTRTFLLVQRETMITSDTSPIEFAITTRFSDYRPVGGVMVAFRSVTSNINFGDIVTQLRKAEHNVEIPDSAFRPPATK